MRGSRRAPILHLGFWTIVVAFLKTMESSPTAVPSGAPTLEPTPSPTAAHPLERSALSALYLSTRGKTEWMTRTNWMDNSKHVSEWFGIKTSSGGSVTEVTMIGNGLRGSLPSEVAYLAEVTDIHLNYNNLMSSVPSEMGLLVKMDAFHLSYNSMNASVPSELGQYGNTKTFHLDSNSFSSAIPSELGKLTSAVHFVAYENRFSFMPSELGKLISAVDFDLDNNFINSSIPTEFGLLRGATAFILNDNRIKSTIPSELGLLVRFCEEFFFGRKFNLIFNPDRTGPAAAPSELRHGDEFPQCNTSNRIGKAWCRQHGVFACEIELDVWVATDTNWRHD